MRTETDAILSLQRVVAAALPDFTAILTEVEHETPERPFAVVSAIDNWTPDDDIDSPTVTLPVSVYAYVKGETRKAAREAAEAAREMLWRALLGVDAGYNTERLVPLYDYTGRPAVQTFSLAGAASGTWAIVTDDGQHTIDLPVTAQPRDVRLALESLTLPLADPLPLVGNLMAFGRRRGPWSIRFDGAARGIPIPTMAIDTSDLAGPDPQGAVEVLSEGSPDAWRDPRDYLEIEAPSFGGMRDPDDPRLRTVTLTLRLTWGRSGHVTSPEMTLQAIRARRSTPA